MPKEPSNADPIMEGRKPDGTFAPGHKCATGRAAGSRNKATLAIEKLLEGEAEGITRKAIDMALEGNVQAMKLVMDRIAPPPKTRKIELSLPETVDAVGVSEAQSTVLRAVAAGDITPDEGATLSGMLEARRRAVETQELEKRINALEQQNGP
jgi:thioredoxin-like negative regulator of GroEL